MVALIEYTPMAPQENPGMEWRYMINPDKSPTAQFEQLCLGIAAHIVRLVFSSLQSNWKEKKLTLA